MQRKQTTKSAYSFNAETLNRWFALIRAWAEEDQRSRALTLSPLTIAISKEIEFVIVTIRHRRWEIQRLDKDLSQIYHWHANFNGWNWILISSTAYCSANVQWVHATSTIDWDQINQAYPTAFDYYSSKNCLKN